VFNSLRGRISFKDETRVMLLSGDVEWELAISRTSADDLPEAGEEARLYVHLYHREDQLRLYGFSTVGEREMFLDLMKVEGVGPRQALKVLSGIAVHRLVEALEKEDLGLLSTIPGVGPKTAQKILLKLKGKLSVPPATGLSMEEDLANALIGMGFERKSARSAVAGALRILRERELPREELERELLKTALAQLSGRSSGPQSGRSSGPESGRSSGPQSGKPQAQGGGA
jgi:Holliday junction DNA helicase RuvA